MEALPESWYEYNSAFSTVTSFYAPSSSSKEATITSTITTTTTAAAATSSVAQTDSAQGTALTPRRLVLDVVTNGGDRVTHSSLVANILAVEKLASLGWLACRATNK